jgi:hypothetical protein
MYINEDMKGMENGLTPACKEDLLTLRRCSRSLNKAVILLLYRSYDISGAMILHMLASDQVIDGFTGKPNGTREVQVRKPADDNIYSSFTYPK